MVDIMTDDYTRVSKMNEGRIIFFSHSLTTYYTQAEKLCLEFIRTHYPNYYIINPRDIALEHHWDFDACMRHLLPEVQRCEILFWYKDDSHSPGVDTEIAEAHRLGKQVRELTLCPS